MITVDRTGLWADLLDPMVRFRADLGFNRRASQIANIFNVEGTSKAYESLSGVGAIGIEAWDSWRLSGIVGNADFDQGYKVTIDFPEYVMELPVTRKAIDDGGVANTLRIAERIGDSAWVKREVDAASVFNNAFTDTSPYAGADSVGLCSTAHPWSPQKTGSTQSNEGTYSLTRDNLATVRQAMMAFTDDNGNKMGVTPNALIVPPALGDKARVETKTGGKTGSADNDLNPRAGEEWQVFEWHFLTDSNAWFMVDTALMKQSLHWFNRVAFYVVPKQEDKTVVAHWIAYMRYGAGWSGWQWVYGNNPS